MLGDGNSIRSVSFSRCKAGDCTPPVWKDAHAPRSVLNSSVKNNGIGVGVKVGLGVNVVVAVAGSGGVCVAAIGVDSALRVAGGLWQALIRMRHAIRSFFMRLLITQLSSAKLDNCV